ncbi:MAG: hypothetical protein QM530_10725 [Phycisphaerales bacterium]|nr:hypothetical protein [Phycisphaerales bacterium]
MKRLSILLFALTTISCKRLDVESGTPKCVVNKIRVFNQSAPCNDSKVLEYLFQGKSVFMFEPGTCENDMSAEVINADCNTLGYLDGFVGNTKINGEEFSKARFIKTTWAK